MRQWQLIMAAIALPIQTQNNEKFWKSNIWEERISALFKSEICEFVYLVSFLFYPSDVKI
jgi:hypothetical protein